jgi:hypothetical protein
MTFKQRNTTLSIPIQFEEQEIIQLQRLWSNHISGLGDVQKQLNLPEKIDDVLVEINAWIALFCAV